MAKAASSTAVVPAPATRVGALSRRLDATSERPDELSGVLKSYLQQTQSGPAQQDGNPAEVRRKELKRWVGAGLISNVMQGYWLAQTLAEEGPEGFRDACAENNLGRATGYERVAEFRLFNQFEDIAVIQALSVLDAHKVHALKLDRDDCEALARGEEVRGITLDIATESSVRDLKQRQTNWHIQNEAPLRKLNQQVAEKDDEIAALREELLRRNSSSAFLAPELENLSLSERTVRDESYVLTEHVRVAADRLAEVAREHLFTKAAKPKDAARQPVAAGSMYFRLCGNLAELHQLKRLLEDTYPDHCAGGMNAEYQYSESEIKHHLKLSEQLFARAATDAKVRSNDRVNSTPGRVGAPRGPRQKK